MIVIAAVKEFNEIDTRSQPQVFFSSAYLPQNWHDWYINACSSPLYMFKSQSCIKYLYIMVIDMREWSTRVRYNLIGLFLWHNFHLQRWTLLRLSIMWIIFCVRSIYEFGHSFNCGSVRRMKINFECWRVECANVIRENIVMNRFSCLMVKCLHR